MLAELTDEVIDGVIDAAAIGSGSPLQLVEFRQLGGALARSAPDHGARPDRPVPGQPPDPAEQHLAGRSPSPRVAHSQLPSRRARLSGQRRGVVPYPLQARSVLSSPAGA
jgi:hypothetical protein